MTHVPADVRVLRVQSKLSSSTVGSRLQLEAAFDYVQAAVTVWRGGRLTGALYTAVCAHVVVPPVCVCMLMSCVSAVVAAVDQATLPAARPGRS